MLKLLINLLPALSTALSQNSPPGDLVAERCCAVAADSADSNPTVSATGADVLIKNPMAPDLPGLAKQGLHSERLDLLSAKHPLAQLTPCCELDVSCHHPVGRAVGAAAG